MFPCGMKFNQKHQACPGDELRELSADPANLDIMARHQHAFDSAMDAHMARKVGSPREAILPLLEIHQLIPTDASVDRDFLTGENT